MTTELSYTDTRDFPAKAGAVFAALQMPAPADAPMEPGKLLALDHISGPQNQTGAVQQARYHAGPLDLIAIEVLTHFDPPHQLGFRQQPDCLQRHNPAERDIDFHAGFIDDLDRAFIAQFGDPPVTTTFDFDLNENEAGTRLTVTVSSVDSRRLRWFARRRWQKNTRKHVGAIFQQVAGNL